MSRNCKEDKVPWLSYVREFVKDNSDIDKEMFGNWIQILGTDHRLSKTNKEHHDPKNKTPRETPENILQPVQEGQTRRKEQSENQSRNCQQNTVEVDQSSKSKSVPTGIG
jgi:hypothetical protein